MYNPNSHPLGRHTFNGTISTIHNPGQTRLEVTLTHEDGWTVTGHLPTGTAAHVGDTVTMTATLKPGHGCDVEHGRFLWAWFVHIGG